MHNIISSRPDLFVLSHRSFFGYIWITFSIQVLMNFWNTISHSNKTVWKESVNDHGFNNQESYIWIPLRFIIIVRTFENLSDEMRRMFCQVSVSKKKQETCVNIEHHKNTIST